MTGVRLFSMLNPSIGLIFTLVFLALWLNQRQRTYILAMAGATFFFAAAVFAQVFLFRGDWGPNALLSCFLYLTSLCFFTESVAMRVGVHRSYYGSVAISAVIFFLIYYYFYVDRQLIMRIYVLNIGIGVLFCYAAARLAMAGSTRAIDRVMFWLILLAGLHFLPRTILTLLADRRSGLPLIDHFLDSNFWTLLNFSMVVIALLLCLCFVLAVTLDTIEDLRSDRNRDALTPLMNRRAFEEQAQALLARPRTERACLIFGDIDHFKSINDTFGHGAGDETIRQVGTLIARELRQGDIAARIGGEEFAILMPRAAYEEARTLAERLRMRIAAHPIEELGGARITMSFGLSEAFDDEPLSELMVRADGKLYQAKRSGRNRVEG